MQLRKPLVQRTVIKPEAIDIALEIVDNKWVLLEQRLERMGDLRQADKVLASRLRPLHKRDKQAIERMKADLGGMPYEEIGATQRGERIYIYGRTKPIEAIAYGSERRYGRRRRSDYENMGDICDRYDLGNYKVILHTRAFTDFTLNHCHLVPERDPLTRDRHYHHTAHSGSYYDRSDILHPLDADPHWCTASFSTIFSSLFNELDFAGVFKIMHRFLCVYDIHSPLTSSLPHQVRIQPK